MKSLKELLEAFEAQFSSYLDGIYDISISGDKKILDALCHKLELIKSRAEEVDSVCRTEPAKESESK